MKINAFNSIIGLEVHVELKTKSKMFCGCYADYFGAKPNTHVCPICLGLPGALPVPNKKAIEWCVMIGLALNCKIPLFSKFDRKNYFYPDLPKGYQISQYDQPFAIKGSLKLKIKNEKLKIDEEKIIRIRRVHMEEDTAKLVHEFGNQKSKIKNQNEERFTLIDFNRSGVPLVEIVTEPDFENARQVVEYLKKLQQIVRYLNVSDADMEKGEMRLEPNVSLKPVILGTQSEAWRTPESLFDVRDAGQASMTDKLPPYKVEVKNINSFRFVEKAIDYEIKRQKEILNEGKIPLQETRGWDEDKQKTVSQRIKEEAHDYRYFPEPDIPPICFTQNQISNIKNQIGELPEEKLEKFQKNFGLSTYDAEILTREKVKADHFEKVLKEANKNNISPKQIANFIINEKFFNIKGKEFDWTSMSPSIMIKLYISLTKTISTDEKVLEKAIEKVLTGNTKAVEDFKSGKKTALMFLIGQTIRQFEGKIDVKMVAEKLRKVLQ